MTQEAYIMAEDRGRAHFRDAKFKERTEKRGLGLKFTQVWLEPETARRVAAQSKLEVKAARKRGGVLCG